MDHLPPGHDAAPLIGITTYVERARWNAWDMPAALVPHGYVSSVSRAGGRPLLVPPSPQAAAETIAALDGLVLAGGADLDPGLYGAQTHPETQGVRPDRDFGELALVAVALKHRLPVLGICRGMELINVTLGGDLVQHLPDVLGADEHRAEPGHFAEHPIEILRGTPLADRLAGHGPVCSYHHQALGRLAEPLEPVALAHDGIVEAVVHRELPFLVGVLWHPEAGADPRIFAALIDAARDHRVARGHRIPEQETTHGA